MKGWPTSDANLLTYVGAPLHAITNPIGLSEMQTLRGSKKTESINVRRQKEGFKTFRLFEPKMSTFPESSLKKASFMCT